MAAPVSTSCPAAAPAGLHAAAAIATSLVENIGLAMELHEVAIVLTFFVSMAFWRTLILWKDQGGKRAKHGVEVSPPLGSGKRRSGSAAREEVQRIQGLAQSHYTTALRAYRELVRSGDEAAIRDEELYASLVYASIRVGHLDVVRELLGAMTRRGLRPSPDFWRSVVKLLSSKRLYADCLSLHEAFGDPQALDPTVCSCVSAAAVSCGRPDKALELIEHLRISGARITCREYGCLFRFYANAPTGGAQSARLVERLWASGVEVGTLTLNRVLASCVQLGEAAQAQRLLAAAEALWCGAGAGATSPRATALDRFSYNAVLRGCAKSCNLTECFRLISRMTAQGIQPDGSTYGILVDACVSADDLGGAVDVLGRLTEAGCEMSTVIYTMLMQGVARAGLPDRAMEIYELMRGASDAKAARPDLVTYGVLIKAYCDAARLEPVLRVLQHMAEDGVRPDGIILHHLLSGCCQASDVDLGHRLFTDLVDTRGVVPSEAAIVSLLKLYGKCGWCDEARRLVGSMEDRCGQPPTTRTMTCFISGLVRNGRLDEAWAAYVRMQELGLPPDQMALATVQPASVGNPARALRLARDAAALDLPPPG